MVSSGTAVTIRQAGGIALQTTETTLSGPVTAGQIVNLTYTLTNSGAVPLTGVVVTADNGTPGDTSDDFNSALSSPTGDTNLNGNLDPGETWKFFSTHVLTQNEIDAAAPLVVTATAISNQSGPVVSSAAVTMQPTTGLAVLKTANLATVVVAGQTITYTYTVTNSGVVPLYGVSLVDDNATPTVPGDDFSPVYVRGDTNTDGAIDPGETWIYTATQTVTQAEFNAGTPLVGTVTATSGAAYSAATVAVQRNATVTLDKSANRSSVSVAGDLITYTYTVTNTGNITVNNVTVTDDNGTPGVTTDDFNPTPVLGSDHVHNSGDANKNGKLDPGEKFLYRSTHIVTQAEIDAGLPLTDTATVATDQNVAYGSAAVKIQHSDGGIAVVKTASPTTFNTIGQTITYTYSVKDSGFAPLANVVLTDDNGTPTDTTDDFSPTPVLAADKIHNAGDANNNNEVDPGEVWTYTSTHVVLQSEVNQAAALTSTVTATDGMLSGAAVTIQSAGGIAVVKSADTTAVTAAGKVITYTYIVTNSGSTPLTGVMLTDDNGTPTDTTDDPTFAPPTGDTNSDGKLDPSRTWTYTSTRTVTQAEFDTGTPLTGTAKVISTQSGPAYSGVTITMQHAGGINVQKTATPAIATAVGQHITYSYAVTNTGLNPLTGVALTDDNGTPTDTTDDPTLNFVSGDTNNNGQLDPNETWTYTATHIVTQAEITAKTPLTSTVRATADPMSNGVAVGYQRTGGGITLVKSANTGATAANQWITYTYTVKNTGTVALTNVAVTDDSGTPQPVLGSDYLHNIGDANNNGKLESTETWLYTSTHFVTQAEFNAGMPLKSTGTATSSQSTPVKSTVMVPIAQHPGAITLQKTASPANVTAIDQVVTYTYTVTNTGVIPLTGVFLTDDSEYVTPVFGADKVHNAGDTNNNGSLDWNETWTYTATHTVTLPEFIAATPLIDTATVYSDQLGPTVSAAAVMIGRAGGLTVQKTADTAAVTAPGQTINYTYTVRFSGSGAATTIKLVDDNGTPGTTSDDFQPTYVSGDTNGNGQIDPSEVWTYTSSHVVTAAEFAVGMPLIDTATVRAAQESDSAVVTVVRTNAVTIRKSADVTSVTAAGQTINYTYTLSNVGTTTVDAAEARRRRRDAGHGDRRLLPHDQLGKAVDQYGHGHRQPGV